MFYMWYTAKFCENHLKSLLNISQKFLNFSLLLFFLESQSRLIHLHIYLFN